MVWTLQYSVDEDCQTAVLGGIQKRGFSTSAQVRHLCSQLLVVAQPPSWAVYKYGALSQRVAVVSPPSWAVFKYGAPRSAQARLTSSQLFSQLGAVAKPPSRAEKKYVAFVFSLTVALVLSCGHSSSCGPHLGILHNIVTEREAVPVRHAVGQSWQARWVPTCFSQLRFLCCRVHSAL